MVHERLGVAVDKKELEDFIARWLSRQLGMEVSTDAAFGALGFDSLDAVELTDALAEKLGVEEVDISLILDYPSASRLAEYLASSERE